MLKQIHTFFASVQLAIFTLTTLAVSSIIGTIIPQGKPVSFYVQKFGKNTAEFIQVLDISQMYTSWWFVGFLGLLAINLIVCSIKRFPAAWRIIQRDNLAASRQQLEKMPAVFHWQSAKPVTADTLTGTLQQAGWKQWQQRTSGTETTFFFQQGRWSRLGVYLVHLSILIIFAGALVGYFGGFRASMNVSEGRGMNTAYSFTKGGPIPLGFTVHCNAFFIDFYDNGMPKEYRSDISIIENGTEVTRQNIKVNTPFTYKGITFYQASYQGYKDFLVTITELKSGERKIFQIPFQQSVRWQEKNLQVGILNVESRGMRVLREKLWFKAGGAPAIKGWLADNSEQTFTAEDKEYRIKVKQLYATGLQVSKDPGVWLVYIGCLLMLTGLYMAFFMSHKRAWLLLQQKEGSQFLLAADSNKNRRTMQRNIERLHQHLQKIYPPITR